MKSPKLTSISVATVILAGLALLSSACQSPTPTSGSTAGLVRFQVHDGDKSFSDLVVLTPVDQKPRVRFFPAPDFYFDPKLTDTVAKVVMDLEINSAGKVIGCTVVESTLDAIGPAMTNFVARAVFVPAQVRGQPAPCRVRLTVEFPLHH